MVKYSSGVIKISAFVGIMAMILSATPAFAKTNCKDMATNIVSLDARVKTSQVNETLRKAWEDKLVKMRADFAAKKCDNKLLDEQQKIYDKK